MNQQLPDSHPAQMEAFLSSAYQRILRITIILSVAATIVASLFFNWHSGLGMAIGSLLAYVNFVWLHYGSELMIRRMIAPAKIGPSKFRLVITFTGRYVFVIAMAYVILKSYPSMLIGFMVGLALPILAAMCEGVYEAVASSNNDQNPD
jgi:hypothetical protein